MKTVTIPELDYSILKASNDEAKRIAGEREIFREELRSMVRIVEAMRMSTGLGKNQIERLEQAKALLANEKAQTRSP